MRDCCFYTAVCEKPLELCVTYSVGDNGSKVLEWSMVGEGTAGMGKGEGFVDGCRGDSEPEATWGCDRGWDGRRIGEFACSVD